MFIATTGSKTRIFQIHCLHHNKTNTTPRQRSPPESNHRQFTPIATTGSKPLTLHFHSHHQITFMMAITKIKPPPKLQPMTTTRIKPLQPPIHVHCHHRKETTTSFPWSPPESNQHHNFMSMTTSRIRSLSPLQSMANTKIKPPPRIHVHSHNQNQTSATSSRPWPPSLQSMVTTIIKPPYLLRCCHWSNLMFLKEKAAKNCN
jgi:hypothetical protein